MMTASGALLLSVALLVCPGGGDGSMRGPFDDADLVPPDVNLFVQIEHAAAARAELSARPIAGLLDTVFSNGELARAWHGLAVAAGLGDEELFDMFLGRRFTFMSRPERSGTDWAILAEVSPDLAATIVRGLDPKWRAPRHNLPITDIPEHDLLMARDGSTYLIGPKRPGRLFDEMLPRLAGVGAVQGSLADDPMMATALSLGGGQVGLFQRHELPLGGVSTAVADLAGDQITITYAGRFENAPFATDETTELRWNVSLLDAFEGNSLLAVMQPTDLGGGPAEAFLEATIGAPLLSAEMRANRGDVQLFAIGEVEGRREPHGVDLLMPTGSVVIEAKDPATAGEELDIHCLRLVRALEDLGDGAYRLEIPRQDAFVPGEPRCVDLDPAMEALAGPWQPEGDAGGERPDTPGESRDGGFPLLRSVSANWTIAECDLGTYYVIATHPEQLERTVAALKADLPRSGRTGRLHQSGIFNGPRLSSHLRTYSSRAELFTKAENPEEIEAFRETMQLLAELAGGINRCRWQMARPTADEVRLEVQLKLSPPESAAGE